MRAGAAAALAVGGVGGAVPRAAAQTGAARGLGAGEARRWRRQGGGGVWREIPSDADETSTPLGLGQLGGGLGRQWGGGRRAYW